jgi:hypothetical protein
VSQFSSNPSYAMTKGEWEKVQEQLDRPVSMVSDGPKLRKGSQEKYPVASTESIFDGIANRAHSGKVKY